MRIPRLKLKKTKQRIIIENAASRDEVQKNINQLQKQIDELKKQQTTVVPLSRRELLEERLKNRAKRGR